MKNLLKRIAIVSLNSSGGCFYYANRLFENFQGLRDIYIPDIIHEPGEIKKSLKVRYAGHPAWVRYFSLFKLLIKLFVYGILGKYKCLILSGAGWDDYVAKVWSLTRRPMYYIIHDGKMHTGEHNEKYQKQLIGCMKRASNLVFLSNFVKETVKRNFGIEKPSVIVPHGLISYGDISKNKVLEGRKPTILFIGRGNYYKGLDILFDSLNLIQCDNYEKIIIAGKMAEEVSKSIPDSVRANKKVEIIDKWLSTDEIRHYVGEADIMLYPYREASQSGSLMLALNYEIPQIVSNVGALAEQTSPDCAIIIDNINPENLAFAISELCDDPERLKKMRKATKQVKNRYNWKSISTDFENYIRDRI